jgi:thiol:disulfide interchange protein
LFENPEGGVGPDKASGIAWVSPASGADVDAAFASAKAKNQPVFLFWTAAWCPPCNQVKSTIFTRSDFIDTSRSFVPVYVDGDTPGGQSLGKRFNVSAYPTMVLLRHDGTEVTRLAGSVDAAKYMQLLQHGLAGGSSARQALAMLQAKARLKTGACSHTMRGRPTTISS